MAATALSEFTFERVLNENARQHSLVLLGQRRGQAALVILEKRAFDASQTGVYDFNQLASAFAKVQGLGENDAYHWMLAELKGADSGAGKGIWPAESYKLSMISPATETHIRKHSPQNIRMFTETPKVYQEVVLPYIQSFPPDRLSWVYNILDHVTEAERIVYEDSDSKQGFIIVPDLKWDQKNPSTLYLQAIVHDRALRSVRDLTSQQLPMLRNLRKQATFAAQKFGLQPDETHVSFEMGSNSAAAHIPLDEIIDQIELSAEDEVAKGPYFQRRALVYGLGDQHALFEKLRGAAGK